jgi:nickel-dependent lactate racemase
MIIANDIMVFSERWQEKTKHYGTKKLTDVFDHFFSAFVLYNFLYNQVSEREHDSYKKDTEKATKTIRKYLGSELIFFDKTIKKNAKKIQDIISTGTFYVRDSSWDAKRIEKLDSPDIETWSKGLLEIIYSIRCNAFHGSKEFTENQKQILIPCIRIIERINSMVIEKINDEQTDATASVRRAILTDE